VGGGQKQLKDKWAVECKDETIALIEVGGQKSAKAQAEIGAEKAMRIIKTCRYSSLNDKVQPG
jgi:hypothetical protein